MAKFNKGDKAYFCFNVDFSTGWGDINVGIGEVIETNCYAKGKRFYKVKFTKSDSPLVLCIEEDALARNENEVPTVIKNILNKVIESLEEQEKEIEKNEKYIDDLKEPIDDGIRNIEEQYKRGEDE